MRESFAGAAPDFAALNPGYIGPRGAIGAIASSYLMALIWLKIASAPISFA
jgi:hypothetical protein